MREVLRAGWKIIDTPMQVTMITTKSLSRLKMQTCSMKQGRSHVPEQTLLIRQTGDKEKRNQQS